jgi:toxin-antitoxin system PIN domain toxin
MLLPDVNVFVSAFRADSTAHSPAVEWLQEQFDGVSAFAYSEWVLSAFIRLCSNPRVFRDPALTADTIQFAEEVRRRPNARAVSPGSRHWGIFVGLCDKAGVRGDLIPDAYLAALAIESGCELVTFDRGFERFDGLRWELLRT